MLRIRDSLKVRRRLPLRSVPKRPLCNYHLSLVSNDSIIQHGQRRQLGFIGAIVRGVIGRLAAAAGVGGGALYYADKQIRHWEDTTFRPVIDQIDRLKDVTRFNERKDYLRNSLAQFDPKSMMAPFNELMAAGKIDQSESTSEEGGREEGPGGKNDEDQSNETNPSSLIPVGVTAAVAPVIAEVEKDDEKEKELLANLEKLAAELEDLQSTKRDLEKTVADLNVLLGSNEVVRTEMLSTIRELQDAASAQEVRHHKKIEKLDGEVNELHSRLAEAQSQMKVTQRSHNTPKSLVELYSTVLDELEHAKAVCPNIKSPDLPRVVVVGDQSSGKTSVLEAVARARIFPRGAGQMMTRSPVKVTIMDGPRHIATFPNCQKMYRLDDEGDLAQLREDIERRMNLACADATISSETVSINIQGPGLRRMVLVDLPGIIATETAGIKAGTAADIINLAKEQMAYDNAIILCVQDGSVDAERSQVTNFVRQADPSGERTLLVLTKVDRAVADPVRLKQILDGKLFPLRALGYFAVVSGTDDRDASISTIRKFENDFFHQSKLLRSGILKADQLGTQNMCDAVSRIFWTLVKSSISSELFKLKEQLFLLETEWKNKYRHARELDREQLFQKGKDVLLDRIVELENLDPGEFESQLKERLWEEIGDHFLHEVYLAAEGSSNNRAEFNTISDIRLRNFTNTTLPMLSLRAAKDLLLQQFHSVIVPAQGTQLYNKIFEEIRTATEKNFLKFQETIATERMSDLKIIQQSTIDNRFVQSQTEWEAAADSLTRALGKDLGHRWDKVYSLAGPVWYQQYWSWSSRTDEQFKWDRTKRILETLSQKTPSRLPKDEVAKVRFAVEKRFGVTCSENDVDDVWNDFYPTRWIADLQYRATDCKRCYKKFKNNQISENRSRLQCDDVLLWWRMDRTVEMTAANLRQKLLGDDGVQILADNLKQVVSEISENSVTELITGRQVDLAEELKYVRKIHRLLKELHEMLLRVSR